MMSWRHMRILSSNKETRSSEQTRFDRSKSKTNGIKSTKEMLLEEDVGFSSWHSVGLELLAAILLVANNSMQIHPYLSSLEIVRYRLLISPCIFQVCVDIH